MSADVKFEMDKEKKLSSCLDIICIICEHRVRVGQYSACVHNHVICWSCEPANEGSSAILSNSCRGCQKKLIDPTNLIPRHPPKLEKTYILQKLVQESQAVCEVPRHNSRASKQLPADVFCSDCSTYICSGCISDHIETEDSISQHTIISLKRKSYEANKPWCLDCKQAPAISFCKHSLCAKSVCPQCLRNHSDHDVLPLNLAQEMMREYVRKHCEDVNVKYRDVVQEKDSLSEERKVRKSEILEVSNLVHEWARKLRKKIDNDEKELLSVIDKYSGSMDDRYFSLFDILNDEDVSLSYFRHLHNIFQECDIDEKFVDAYTFLRLNETIIADGGEDFLFHANSDTGFRCEKIEFKLDQRAINAVQANTNGQKNILGAITQQNTMSMTDSISGKHSQDTSSQKLSALTLSLDGKLILLDTGNRKIKVVSPDNLDEVTLTVDIANILNCDRQYLPSQVLFDERKTNFIVNVRSKSSILEIREDGSVFRRLDNVKNCTALCLCREFLYVARIAEPTDCFRGILDKFDRITWTKHSANELNVVPNAIALAPGNTLLISDTKSECVYALDTIEFCPLFVIEGVFADSKLRTPNGLTCTSRGHILVCDTYHNRILEFSSTGKFLRVFLSDKDGLKRPERLVCDSHDSLYVLDGGGAVKVFNYVHGESISLPESETRESSDE